MEPPDVELERGVLTGTPLLQIGKKMEIFRWVRIMLIAVVVLMGFRLFAEGFGWYTASAVASVLGIVIVVCGFVLGVVGMVQDRKSTLNRRLEMVRRTKEK